MHKYPLYLVILHWFFWHCPKCGKVFWRCPIGRNVGHTHPGFTMLVVFLLFISVFSCSLMGCATVKPFPPEDIVVYNGKEFLLIKKGDLDERYRGKWWITKDEFIQKRIPKRLDEEL